MNRTKFAQLMVLLFTILLSVVASEYAIFNHIDAKFQAIPVCVQSEGK